MTAKLEARRVSVRYGKTRGIQDVSLIFPTNQVTGLIGPSGCGKSTFLRAINRMHELSDDIHVSGEVLLDGSDVLSKQVDPVDVRRRIGMVFQRPNPLPKSIFENVAFGLRVAGERNRDVLGKRVEQSLERAALWDEVKDRLDESAMGLSGGQQQRLCIARAIAPEPEVLLMDEPASALDPLATERIEELIGELREGYTIVLVTHSMQQARRVSDRTAFFWMGELIEEGSTEAMFEAPRESRTRDYFQGRVG
jgi:phosphate transport system ATP-binding protein